MKYCRNKSNDGILSLNEKHVKEGLHHKNLLMNKYLPDHIKNRYELVDGLKKQANITFIGKELAIKVIIAGYKFRTRLGFK